MSRFSDLSAKLAAKGAHDPDALAAYIGRKKYGRQAFAAMAAAGRHMHGRSEDLAEALHRGEPPQHTDTPGQGAVMAEPDPAQGHHSGPVLTRAAARARLLKSGVLL